MFQLKSLRLPVFIITIGYLAYLLLIYVYPNITVHAKAAFPHPKATLGLPAAAVFAVVMVSDIEDSEHSIFGWRVKGKSARVILWAIVFTSLVISLEVLW